MKNLINVLITKYGFEEEKEYENKLLKKNKTLIFYIKDADYLTDKNHTIKLKSEDEVKQYYFLVERKELISLSENEYIYDFLKNYSLHHYETEHNELNGESKFYLYFFTDIYRIPADKEDFKNLEKVNLNDIPYYTRQSFLDYLKNNNKTQIK
jgi:hypothetical protein